MDKRRIIIWILAGGYLIYLGIDMFRRMRQEQPTNMTFFMAMSVLFIVVGAIFVVSGLRPVIKKIKESREAKEAIVKETLDSNDENVEEQEKPESKPEEAEPKKAEPKRKKTMRERAMLGADVEVASEDIIAATEEIIVTQESEDAIVNINTNGSEGQERSGKPKETLDDGLTRVIK